MEATTPKLPWRAAVLRLALPALVLRLLSLWLCADDPLVRWPFGDGLAYAKWALSISEGDVLGRSRPVFYQAPLYPYVLALLQSLGLGFFPWPQILNAFAGAGAALLVFGTTFRVFGSKAAWIAGALMALWGPALMVELWIDKSALGLCAVAGFAWLAVRLERQRREGGLVSARSWILLGVCAGVLSLLRENLLLLAFAIGAWVIWRSDSATWRARLRPAALLACGLLIGVAPSLLHNVAMGGAFVPTTYQSGTNLWMGNHAGAEGTYESLYAERGDAIHEESDARRMAAAGLGRTPNEVRASQVQRWFWARSLEFAATEPFAWAALQLRKLHYFVYHVEAPDTVPYASFRAESPWLLPSRLLVGLLVPFALLGLWRCGSRREARLLRVLAIVSCASVIAFYVVSRYRLACLPLLMPFAAHGFLLALAAVRERRWLASGVLVPACALIPAQLWLLPRAPRGLGDTEQAALLSLTRGTVLANWSPDKRDAIPELRRSIERAPAMLAAHRALARTLLHPDVAGYEEACRVLSTLVTMDSRNAETWHNLAFAQHRAGRPRDALVTLRRAEQALAAPLPEPSRRLRDALKSASTPRDASLRKRR